MNIVECHGSLNQFQCNTCAEIFEAPNEFITLDQDKYTGVMPTCINCISDQKDEHKVRPNILMFGDYDWLSSRTDE